MSGQFEQRRLARPAYQLDVLDAFVGDEQVRASARRARRLAGARSPRAGATTRSSRDAGAAAARVEALRDLVERTEGLERGEEDALRAERERMRHAAELAEGAARATAAVAPDDGDGAASLAAAAERALEPLTALAPELEGPTAELRELAVRLSEVGSDLHRFVASLDADPARIEEVESRLDLIAELRGADSSPRRSRSCSIAATRAVAELDALDGGLDPVAAAAAELAEAEERFAAVGRRAADREERRRGSRSPPPSPRTSRASAWARASSGSSCASASQARPVRDEVAFLIRPNPGMPFGPVAETASGGELSRVALALAVVAGGETLVFDEIDAGIGGVTAHRVAETLSRLAERAQVITITHLPQIANVAERHFRVEKVPGDPTHTRIEQLSADERRAELERMLGGEEFLTAIASEQRP